MISNEMDPLVVNSGAAALDLIARQSSTLDMILMDITLGDMEGFDVIQTIRRMAPGDSIVCTDVGQHQMWSIQHFHFDYPGQLITSGGFGTMGFGLGAAIGAKQGNPDKTVIAPDKWLNTSEGQDIYYKACTMRIDSGGRCMERLGQ